MAFPKHEIVVTTPTDDIPLVDVEMLEDTRIASLHAFIVKHTNITEQEYAALTLGDAKKLGETIRDKLQADAVPLASSAP